MSYQEFTPHSSLQDKIDCYWMIRQTTTHPGFRKIIPDGCIDIIINLGNRFNVISENFTVQNEAVILAGPMTKLKFTENVSRHYIIGIRFKPFGFHSFFDFQDLSTIQDVSIQLHPKDFVPDFKLLDNQDVVVHLNQFFLKKNKEKTHYIQHIVNTLDFNNPLEVPKIAKEYYVTERTLQRHFLKYAGMPLKRYHSIMRVQKAMALLASGKYKRLSDVFYPLHYYDHAHFTNEFSRLTGISPAALQ